MRLLIAPASLFGIVLGVSGLGGAWRLAARTWGLPTLVGESLMLCGGAIWACLAVLYLAKWAFARKDAIAEAEHPVQCCFVGLVGVSTMLVGLAAFPYNVFAAIALVLLGAALTLIFALWRTGRLWRGERDLAATTPVLYLPLVAGAFVTATALATIGYPDWGQLAFGAGFFSWLAIKSVLLHRLYTGPALSPALRPTLGIQLAPPAVGAIAYLSVSSGVPDVLAHAMTGYALLQALLLVRMLPWILEQPFSPSYWAFTFGATALAATPLRMMERGEAGAVAVLAPYLFVAANLVVGLIAVVSVLKLTAWLWSRLTGPQLRQDPA